MTIIVNPQDPPVIQHLVERMSTIEVEFDHNKAMIDVVNFVDRWDYLCANDKLLAEWQEVIGEIGHWRKLQKDDPANEALWSDPKEQADVELSHD